ncbi:MAG: GHKL domain-containing protein [Sphaerochaetaceae bacterium]|nr:GHKL domain-containing protein [Sphaerochaetaceae bacterium]
MVTANLLENAITAVSMLDDEQRYIFFKVVYTGQLILEMANPYQGHVAFDKDGLPLSDRENHGYGSKIVADYVKRSGTSLVHDVNDVIFRARISL